jgi:hypothetical protein
MTASPAASPTLHCAVTLGFAGSRQLLDQPSPDGEELAQIKRFLTEHLEGLPEALHLSKAHFLCGLSQIAVGADTLFTQACRDLNYPQWIVLPEPRDEFLNARSASGTPDFTEEERNDAITLLASDHIIHEEVVSNAPDRTSRFEDANLEIVRRSDVVVCLLRADAQRRSGGTEHLLDLAKNRGRPTLEIRIVRKDGKLAMVPTWHNLTDFTPPQLPDDLRGVSASAGDALPSATDYRGALKSFASAQAKGHRKVFRYAAAFIIATHLLATLLAASVLAGHAAHGVPPWVLGVLALELVLLVVGFLVHRYLHRSEAAKRWALVRLIAEITRSIQAIDPLHLNLHYLFWLPLPTGLQPLLHTLNILHLRSTRRFHDDQRQDWTPLRDSYVRNRLTAQPNGQIVFYTRALAADQRLLRIGTATFVVCSLLAMLATGIKLFVSGFGSASEATPSLPPVMGVLAIWFPVLAVGALSFIASMDIVARTRTFAETLEFLKEQQPLLEQTDSFREFTSLLQETEVRLLGEVTNWYSRRSFTSVA